MESLEELSEQLPRKLIVSRAAFGSADKAKSNPPSLAPDEYLCAVILIIEEDGIKNEDFRYWANWCIGKVAAREDFRLFVCLHDLTIDKIKEHANQGDQLFDTLIDTVQLMESPTPDHLHGTLKKYLKELDDIQKAAFFRNLRLTTSIFMGKIAGIVQLLCGLVLAIATFAALVLGSESVVTHLTFVNNSLVALITGSVIFPLMSTPIFLLFQGFNISNILIRDNPRIKYWLILFAVLGPAAIGLPQRIGAPTSWIVLGIVTGFLLDILRRDGYQARRALLSLEKVLEVTQIWPLPADIEQVAKGNPWNPLRCPLFSAIDTKVFISYSRLSNWSTTYATKLHNRLCKKEIQSFFDQAKIEEGSSWRSQLNRNISDANIFIAVLDEISVNRKWVAAEMITALLSKPLTILPEVIILMKSGLLQLPRFSMLPIFKSLLKNNGAPHKKWQPRFITLNDTNLETLFSGLKSNLDSTPSIFPPQLGLILSYLITPAVAIGTLGTFFGFLAIPFAYLQYWDKFNSSASLSSVGIFTVVYLICGYLLGFVARLSLASRYELKHKNANLLSKINFISAIGFIALLAVWGSGVTILIIGWSVVLCWIGWLVCKLFIFRIREKK
jgi:hypothetical protein